MNHGSRTEERWVTTDNHKPTTMARTIVRNALSTADRRALAAKAARKTGDGLKQEPRERRRPIPKKKDIAAQRKEQLDAFEQDYGFPKGALRSLGALLSAVRDGH